jgi:hypothetical protein
MAGRGRIGDVPAIENSRLFMLRNGRWRPLAEPVNYDRPFAGIGLAASFAEAYANRYNADTGLIPCADGGTSLDDWAEGGQLYRHAVCQTLLARRVSDVKGILWHQGEADSEREETARSYKSRFTAMLAALRKECGLEDIPVITGELGAFLANLPENQCRHFQTVNAAFAEIAASRADVKVASAEGFTSNGDNLHFDAPSLREFGRRYFEQYQNFADSKSFCNA